jgi:hypothetical protein
MWYSGTCFPDHPDTQTTLVIQASCKGPKDIDDDSQYYTNTVKIIQLKYGIFRLLIDFFEVFAMPKY